ncbi:MULTISPECIES: ArsR/SmtB family transcription factor [Paenibacillus]|uniref:ArsR/SmtB family transcription factor n=1 Tax=Paenibacillus TaxID=44249 RepID=UPI0022B8682C|nr:ArsR family transcriptional regulator [Paenibacillus caseinilyticus]MCZ8520392.1 ArsR family transcriptional regulator [Paenibacillus caseinilyticus]
MNIQVNSRNMPLLECFASETRVKIIELLDGQPMNIKELAAALQLSSAIITKHIQKLEEHGIVGTESISGTRGRRKVCFLLPDSILLQLKTPPPQLQDPFRYAVSIPVGQYERHSVKPTCGLTSETAIIGLVDDPRYFSDPEHVKAKHLWFGTGFIEYRIPNYLVGRQSVRSLSISLEVCSEAPDYNENWPSDMTFSINGVTLGTWTCPGDFGSTPGVYTPRWWNLGTQHGLLKTITVDERGTYLDGVRLSDLRSSDLAIGPGSDLFFKIACPETAQHPGGVSLFGRQFGNYDQEIEVTVIYEP